MAEINYYSSEGLKQLKDELHFLKNTERARIARAIQEAREKGDLSENAEYDAAKEEQGLLEMRIAHLEETISNARVLDDSQMDTSKCYILSTVELKNIKTGQKFKYTLVSANEADLKSGKLSVESPIGKALLGHEVGDVVSVEVPAGKLELELLSLTR